jgi:hypothetical protein
MLQKRQNQMSVSDPILDDCLSFDKDLKCEDEEE